MTNLPLPMQLPMQPELPPRPKQHPSREDLSIPDGEANPTRRDEAEARHIAHLWERSTQASMGLTYVFDVRDGGILWVNGGVRAVLGWSPEEVVALDGDLRQTLIHPDDLKQMLAVVKELTPLPDGATREMEYRMRHADGSWHWLHSRDVVFARDENGLATQLMGVAVDVTPQKEAEAALHEVERCLEETVEAAKLGIWDWDVMRDRMTCNPHKCRMLGLAPDHNVGAYEDFVARVHPDDRAHFRESIQQSLRTRDGFECEFRARAPSGQVRWISSAGNVSKLDEKNQPARMSGVSLDVSARKDAEAALRRAHDELEKRVQERSEQLAILIERLRGEISKRREAESARGHLLARLVDAQEAERRRLSRELHDQFGQTLTALLLSIESFGEGGALSDADKSRREQARRLAREVMEQSHQMAWELRPASLDNLGLVSALEQLTRDWSRAGVPVDFVAHGLDEKRLSPPVETAFFRVVQEALTNVSRHAAASQVSVILERQAGSVRVIIEDNGRGFASDELDKSRLGLLGMRERLEAIGGTLEVESSPGAGTSVFARSPLDRRKMPREEAASGEEEAAD